MTGVVFEDAAVRCRQRGDEGAGLCIGFTGYAGLAVTALEDSNHLSRLLIEGPRATNTVAVGS